MNFNFFESRWIVLLVILTVAIPVVIIITNNQNESQPLLNIAPENYPMQTRYEIPDEAWEQDHYIVFFEDMAALQSKPDRYELIGMFADPQLADPNSRYSNHSSFFGNDKSWNQIDWENWDPQKYKAGIPPEGYSQFNQSKEDAAFTTCISRGWESLGRGPGNNLTCEYLIGAIRIKNVLIRFDYINFWAASGAEKGTVGIKLLNRGTTVTLASWSDDSCNQPVEYNSGNEFWKHFDVSSAKGEILDILIYDMNSSIPCGAIHFDHFYQSDIPRGRLVDVALDLAMLDNDKDGDGVVDAEDTYPDNALEWSDRDFDGIGDNADRFPDNPAENSDIDNDGVGDNADANPENPSITFTVTGLTLHPEGMDPRNIIETFDDPLAIQADKDRFDLAGIFTSKVLAREGWESKSWPARIGKASVATIRLGRVRAEYGSIRIKAVAINSNYINFLMAGGPRLSFGLGRIAPEHYGLPAHFEAGVKLYAAGTNSTLAKFLPDTPRVVLRPDDNPWYHFDVSALKGHKVDIYIFIEELRHLTFDHFYQGNVPQGKLAGIARSPVASESAGSIDERRLP